MAIAHVETNTDASNTAISTISNHTVSGDNPVLVVKVATRDTTPNQVTGVTWNTNEDLVKLNSDINGNAGVEIWYLKAPTATTADVVITMSESNRCVSAASTYSGVDQNNPFRVAANASNNGTNDAPTVDVVALDTEMVVDSLCQVSAGPDTAAAAHTERHNTAATGGGTDTRGASQEKASSGDTETMSWTMSDSDNWAIAAGALQVPGAVSYDKEFTTDAILKKSDIDKEFTADAILYGGLLDSLVSYWKLDESSGEVIDSHGSNNGTNNGATPNVEGKINTAYDFELGDAGDHIEVTDIDGLAEMTISLWFKPESIGTVQNLVAKDVSGNRHYRFGMSGGGTIFGHIAGSQAVVSTGTLEAGNWYHLCFVFSDTANTAKIYINGSEDGSETCNLSMGSSATHTFIGKREWVGVEEYADGIIDEVAIWSRALDATEIGTGAGTLYNSAAGLAYPFTEAVDKTFTVDSILKKSDNDKEFTTDAFLQVKDNDKEFTTDAILKATTDKGFTVNAILKKSDNDKEFSADAFLQVKDNDKEFTTDALLQVVDNDVDFTVDAFLQVKDNDKEFSVDAILKKSDIDKEFTVDAILEAAGVETYDKTFTVDAILKKSDNDKNFTVDSILKKSDIDKEFTVDASLVLTSDKTFTADSLLQQQDQDKTFTADAFIQQQDNDKEFIVDSILKKSDIDKTFTADAILESVGVVTYDKTFTVDAILESAFDRAGGGLRRIRKIKEYEMDIYAEVIKKKFWEIGIYGPLKIKREKDILINSNIFKETESDLNLFVGLDYRKLQEILDAI